jgi:hypothetical protein
VVECLRCAAYGAAMGAPILAVALLARRTSVEGAAAAALAGVAAALAGNLVLHLQCPNTDVSHQLVAHCGLLLLLPAVVALAWLARAAQRDAGSPAS